MDEKELVKKRFCELAEKSYNNSEYTFTDFCSQGDLSLFNEIRSQFGYVPYSFFGGYDGCERVIIRFGSKELFGYDIDFPIQCIKAAPVNAKFSDNLNHRDFLGAIMNLGIKRSLIGDIAVVDNAAYIFVRDGIAPYIMQNLEKVKHTSVKCTVCNELPQNLTGEKKKVNVQVSSLRCDVVCAAVYKLSRSQSAKLFEAERVFINDRLCTSESYTIKSDDKVTVRGRGRFIFLGVIAKTKKGNLIIEVLI